MRTPRFYKAVAWIAWNDEPLCMEIEEMAGATSVLLVADVFAVEPERVATAVVEKRREEERLTSQK